MASTIIIVVATCFGNTKEGVLLHGEIQSLFHGGMESLSAVLVYSNFPASHLAWNALTTLIYLFIY